MMESSRLRYESVRGDHAPRMYPVLSDERIYRFLPEQPPASVEALQRRFEFLSAARSPDGLEQWLNWMLFLKQSGEPIGYYQATARPPECSIAFVLNPRYWRQGYATEAGHYIIKLLFENFNISAITAEINVRNEASIALVRRLGFNFARHDAENDDDIFELNRSTWAQIAAHPTA